MPHAALDGLRVLDLTRLLPGPFATQLLGDLGADVLKVEDPVKGDYVRFAPPFVGGESARYLSLNRNKRSMKLNLKSPAGREVLKRLVERYDVLIEQFRPGVMERLGVGYEVLRDVNPRLIYCALTGYGQDGPYRHRAGHDLNYLSIAGITGLTGAASAPPGMSGIQIADIAGGGLMACIGLLAAIMHRERTGQGQLVDISMLDGCVSLLAMQAGDFLASGRVPGQETETLNGAQVCYRVYETKDGRALSVGALEPQFWAALMQAIERPDLIGEQFCEGERRAEVLAELEAIFRSRTRDEWTALLEDVDCCVEPVLDLAETFAHPQVAARELVWEVPLESGETARQQACPIKLSETPASVRRAPPSWGAHTADVLEELGYGAADVERLREAQAFD